MSDSGALYDVLMDRLTDPYTRQRIRRALTEDLVLDTWLNGEREESFTPEAQDLISRAAEAFAQEAMESNAIFPNCPMPKGYVRAAFQEVLSSTALYQAQNFKGIREVDQMEARNAEAILRKFAASEMDGLTSVGGLYFVISAHEDLAAIDYYHRMKREDFLLGTLHRPWSDMLLTNQLDVYQRMGLVKRRFTGDGEMLQLTARGEETLGFLRSLLEEAGEFEWRSNAQRWVIFGEMDYDGVFYKIFPNASHLTQEFLDRLEIPPGARVLEIGAGTGRATFDDGLIERITAVGGSLVALDPSSALINVLRKKCLKRGVANMEVVLGAAESLPFPDHSFDVILSIFVLHFTDVEKAVREMVRVVKPGGMVAAMFPAPFSYPAQRLGHRPNPSRRGRAKDCTGIDLDSHDSVRPGRGRVRDVGEAPGRQRESQKVVGNMGTFTRRQEGG